MRLGLTTSSITTAQLCSEFLPLRINKVHDSSDVHMARTQAIHWPFEFIICMCVHAHMSWVLSWGSIFYTKDRSHDSPRIAPGKMAFMKFLFIVSTLEGIGQHCSSGADPHGHSKKTEDIPYLEPIGLQASRMVSKTFSKRVLKRIRVTRVV